MTAAVAAMPDSDLPGLIASYRVSVDRELDALARLERLATDQRDAASAGDYERVLALGADRAVVWAEIVAEEHVIAGTRQTIHERLEAAQCVG